MDQHHDSARFEAAVNQPYDRHDQPARRDGWSQALRAQFLIFLAETGNVTVSARRCRRSAQSVYVQRRRDAMFARGWDAALVLAHHRSEQVLAERALEGWEEAVFYRGEQVGVRRRFDGRLLLAHIARLDSMVQDEAVQHDAGRFDELVAVVAGVCPPPDAVIEGPLPLPREAYVTISGAEVEDAIREAQPAIYCEDPDDDDEEAEANAASLAQEDAVHHAGEEARAEAGARWDGWIDHVHAVVDALGDPGPAEAGTISRAEPPKLHQLRQKTATPEASAQDDALPRPQSSSLTEARAALVSAIAARSAHENPAACEQSI